MGYLDYWRWYFWLVDKSTEEKERRQMKCFITILILFVAVGCATTPTMKSVVGTYEISEGENTKSVVLQYNDIGKIIVNGKEKDGRWKIVNKEVHIVDKGHGRIEVARIESNGDLTLIAVIVDGKRREAPRDEQMTLKKIKLL